MNIWRTACLVLGLSTLVLPGCGGPKPVRGEDVAGFDDQAMSTGLDKRDLQKLLHDNMKALQGSAVLKRWESENQPRVAVMPLRNETTEHVDSALDSLLSDIETILVNTGQVQVISLERQPADHRRGTPPVLRRLRSLEGSPLGQARSERKYFVTGKVYSSDERSEDERRVQYFLFLQIIDAETGAILFQNKTSVTKGLAS